MPKKTHKPFHLSVKGEYTPTIAALQVQRLADRMGYSYSDIRDAIGMEYKTFRSKMLGLTDFTVGEMEKIAKHFGCTLYIDFIDKEYMMITRGTIKKPKITRTQMRKDLDYIYDNVDPDKVL